MKDFNDSLVPYVIEQSARGERSYDIFSRLLKDRINILKRRCKSNICKFSNSTNAIFGIGRSR